jgi:hypothetical protein
MKFIKILLFHCIILGIHTLASDVPAEKYSLLKNEYQKAVTQLEKEQIQMLAMIKSQQIQQANRISQQYRDEGNIGFHLEAKNYADFLMKDQLELMNWDQIQNADLKLLNERMLESQTLLESRMRLKKHLMMTRMENLLEGLLRNNDGNSVLDQSLQADLEKLRSDPEFMQTKLMLEAKEQARLFQETSITQTTSQPTPTPSPVHTKPMLDLDVFRKNTGLKVQIRSKEMRRIYKNMSVDVWFIDRYNDSSKNFVISGFQTLDIPELALGQKVELETSLGRDPTDMYQRTAAGSEFFGYVVGVRDSDGKLLTFKSFPSRFEALERVEKVMSLKTGASFSL